jgi:hypothetical protein
MSLDFFLKRGDTSPALEFVLEPLTALTGATVRFNMRLPGASAAKVSRATAQVVSPATDGKVRYVWQTADTDTAGDYLGEFEVTFQDGSIETFPNADEIKIHIRQDLA